MNAIACQSSGRPAAGSHPSGSAGFSDGLRIQSEKSVANYYGGVKPKPILSQNTNDEPMEAESLETQSKKMNSEVDTRKVFLEIARVRRRGRKGVPARNSRRRTLSDIADNRSGHRRGSSGFTASKTLDEVQRVLEGWCPFETQDLQPKNGPSRAKAGAPRARQLAGHSSNNVAPRTQLQEFHFDRVMRRPINRKRMAASRGRLLWLAQTHDNGIIREMPRRRGYRQWAGFTFSQPGVSDLQMDVLPRSGRSQCQTEYEDSDSQDDRQACK